jgi:hypothetical protein
MNGVVIARVVVGAAVLAALLWTTEAWARPEDTAPSGSRGSRTYQAPVDRAPDVLCGCTEVLKNFA